MKKIYTIQCFQNELNILLPKVNHLQMHSQLKPASLQQIIVNQTQIPPL